MRHAARRQTYPRLHRKQPSTDRRKRRSTPLLKGAAILPTSPTARVFGYARVSTEDQNLDVQTTALRTAGVTDADLFVEKVSAVSAKRPMFNLVMKMMERGDRFIFHALSRIGRDVPQIIGILKTLLDQGIAWHSITEPFLDSTTASGRLMVNIKSAMAQFERDQIIERTQRGMDECKRKGMYLGRPEKISAKDARRMLGMRRRGMTGEEVSRSLPHLHVSPSAVYARTNELKRRMAKR